MPNNSSDTPQGPDAHPFQALLKYLCPEDPDKANHRYIRLHGKLTGFFHTNGMSDPETDADDTVDRAGKKIMEGADIPNINAYCMGIARNIVRERRRIEERERWTFIEFIRQIVNNSESEVDRITDLLKRCFKKLSLENRELLKSYNNIPPGLSAAEHRLRLAKSRNWSISALRIRITRLRRELEKCIKELENR